MLVLGLLILGLGCFVLFIGVLFLWCFHVLNFLLRLNYIKTECITTNRCSFFASQGFYVRFVPYIRAYVGKEKSGLITFSVQLPRAGAKVCLTSSPISDYDCNSTSSVDIYFSPIICLQFKQYLFILLQKCKKVESLN